MDPFDRMVCDAFEDLAPIVLWIEHIQLCRCGQREARCSRFPAGIRTGVEPILSSERNRAHSALGSVVVDTGATVVSTPRMCLWFPLPRSLSNRTRRS